MMVRRVPSFAGLKPASEVSSRTKRNNPRSDTQHELLLRREFLRMGLRFRKNVEALPGKPDIVFSTPQVAVFCDGDFWHGRSWRALKPKLDRGTNANYWSEKIAINIKRDPTAAAKLIRRVVDTRRGKLAEKIRPNRKGRIKR